VSKRYRWKILAIMCCGSFINYVDRASLAIAAPFIVKEFHFTPAMMGTIFSAFFICYAFFNFIGGYLSDIYGPKKTLAVAMVFWSIFAGAPALAWSFTSFIVFRLLFGAGEGPQGSVTNKMVNNWFPPTERARAKGTSNSGFSLGAALAGPIVGLIALRWSWRISFLVITLLGLMWTVIWLKFVTDLPTQHPKVSPEELAAISKRKALSSTPAAEHSIAYYIKQPIIISVAIAYFAFAYATYFFMTWFPSYLVMARHLSIKDMSIVSVIPWGLGAMGYIFGGTISDHLVKKGQDPISARRIVIAICMLGAAIAIALCGLATTATAAIALMSIGILCLHFANPCFWATIQDSVAPNRVGGVGGFVHFVSNLAGIFAPSITGLIVQRTHQFTSAFLVAGILAVAGSLAVAFFAKAIRETPMSQTAAASS